MASNDAAVSYPVRNETYRRAAGVSEGVAALANLSGRAQPKLTRTLAKLGAASPVTVVAAGRKRGLCAVVSKLRVTIGPDSNRDTHEVVRLDETGRNRRMRIMRGDMATRKTSAAVEPSSGNVFADLSLPGSVELDTRMRLAIQVVRALDERRLSLAAAARTLGISPAKMSALRQYEIVGFPVVRLMTFLTVLGRDVRIRVRVRRKRASRGRVLVEAV